MSRITANSDMTRTILRERFAVVRRRLLAVGVGAATGWGLAAGIAVILLAAWIDLALDLPGPIRLGANIAAIIAAYMTWAYFVVRTRHASSTSSMARMLDDAARANGQIVAGVDLMTPPAAGSTVTLGLAQIASRRAVELVGTVPATVAAPTSPLRRPAIVLSAIILFLCAAAILSPKLLATQWARFSDPFGDHPPYSSLHLTVDPGNVKVIFGSAVDIRAGVSNGLADRVELVYLPEGQAEESVPMFPEGEGKWRATLANVVTPGKYFVQAGKARTERYDVTVVTVPQIQKVTFRISLPAYTHRPPYDGALPQAGLAGLNGTTVVVHATSNRPLSGGLITLTENPPSTQPAAVQPTNRNIDLTPDGAGSNEVTGVFQIHASGKFQLALKDTDGQASTDSFGGAIILLNDEKPFVRIIEPRETSFSTPDALIKVLAAAEDDYGLSKLEIYRGLNDSRPRSVDIPIPANQPTVFSGSMNLALGDYGLNPGDSIKLFARTEDNDPAGAKGSESTIATIQIVSQADMDRMQMTRDAMEVLQSKYADAARQLETLEAKAEELQKELDKLDPKSELTPEEKKKLEDLADELAKSSQDVQKLATHDLPLDLDKALKDQLDQVAQAMKDAEQMAKDAGAPGVDAGQAADKLKQMQQALGKQQDQFNQDATTPLDYLAKVYPLIEDEAKFIDLYNRQKDLAERMAAVETTHGQDDPQLKARMRDLQDEQHQMRDDLRELLDDIDNKVSALPEDKKLDDLRASATDFAKAVRDSEADGQMQETENALQEFAGSRASAGAHAAASTLEKFIAKCQGMGDQAEGALKFQPKLDAGLGDTVEQLLGSAGLSKGMGPGSRGGYSAARNSLQNVGLYGQIPLVSKTSSGSGDKKNAGVARADGSPNGRDNPDRGDQAGRLRASGGSDAPVPPQYKKRVGDYFQRVDDEMSD